MPVVENLGFWDSNPLPSRNYVDISPKSRVKAEDWTSTLMLRLREICSLDHDRRNRWETVIVFMCGVVYSYSCSQAIGHNDLTL